MLNLIFKLNLINIYLFIKIYVKDTFILEKEKK